MRTISFKMLLLTGAIAACSNDNSEIIMDLNESIHHDDFEYTVTDYAIEEKIGVQDILTAKGKFYIVSFKVTNNAKRVSHPWDNVIAYVKDEDGKIYENQKEAQLVLDKQMPMGWQEEYVTQAQDNDSILFVFDVPKDVKYPYLMVRGETLMGDFFDGGKFKRKKVKLFE